MSPPPLLFRPPSVATASRWTPTKQRPWKPPPTTEKDPSKNRPHLHSAPRQPNHCHRLLLNRILTKQHRERGRDQHQNPHPPSRHRRWLRGRTRLASLWELCFLSWLESWSGVGLPHAPATNSCRSDQFRLQITSVVLSQRKEALRERKPFVFVLPYRTYVEAHSLTV